VVRGALSRKIGGVTALLSTTIAAEATTTLTWFTSDGAEERVPLTEARSARFRTGYRCVGSAPARGSGT
jgi:hypothetical protein